MGRKFLHEHPATAKSWQLPMVQEILKLERVRIELGDQCVFGQTTMDDNKEVRLAMKPTNWMSNDEFILAAVGKKCPNRFCSRSSPVHVHQPLIGGRARATESYPERFCIAILKALQQSMRHVGLLGNMEAGYHVDEPDMSHEVAKYFDDITGTELEPELVQKARAEEVEFLDRLGT